MADNYTNEFLNYAGLRIYDEEIKEYINEKAPQSDWAQTDSTKTDFIKNKPELENVAYINSNDDENIITDIEAAKEELKGYIDAELQEAKDSGEFDGEKGSDGTSVTVSSVSESTADGGSNVVTFSDGKTLTVKNGSKGKDGTNGTDGKDGKTAYTYAQEGGYTGTEAQFAEDTNPDNMKADIAEAITDDVAEIVKAQIPLVKSAEQPTFVNSIAEMTDPSKVYVMPDGYLYGCKEFEQYNLLKPSAVSYSSRLQDDIAGITTSGKENAVTDWIPIQYGKYYTGSSWYNDKRGVARFNPVRINLKRQDGSIVAYNKGAVPIEVAGNAQKTIKIEYEDAVAIRVHFQIMADGGTAADIGTADKLKALECMIVAGDTADESYNNAVNLDYTDGDLEVGIEWYNTGLAYNQPADYEDRVVAVEADVAELQEDMKELEDSMTNPASASPYYRDVNFGVLPFTYYQGLADNYDSQGFVKGTKYADFIAKWKALVADHSGYVTEADHATASDGQEIYLYDFKPARIDNQDKPIPKMLIVAGQHGFEKSNIYGLYYFVDNLLNRWTQHPSLEYIRNNVELLIVPVLNTYGFDNLEYKNKNGVNTNRNYDSGWVLEADATSPQYGGASPFDQPETQFVRKVLTNNPKTLLVIDFHTCGGRYVDNYHDVNWCGICASGDGYYNRMKDAIAHHLSAITGRFNVDYELNQPNVMMGHMTTTNGNGLLRGWATDNNFIGVLVEGFNGFPNDTDFVGKIYKANEEILVDYLITAMNYLGK